MKWKPLFFQVPISIISLTLLANLFGFLSSTLFQSTYVIFTGVLGEEPLSSQIMYSLGAGMFIAYAAVPFSLVLIIVITLIFSRLNKWHLILSFIIGLFLGISALGSIYWGIPILTYIFTTAVSSCLLIMWRQKHLTKHHSGNLTR
jgi:hypothetical protein